ncbi:MAG: methionine synthase I [Rhodobacteraceae bacterium]|nr:methionine synthase I [Paracoccaceae bacterium]
MGIIGDLLGVGRAVRDVAEVFVPNKTATAEFEHLEHKASVAQFGAEFMRERGGWFNNFVDGLNRLPRPVFALGTVGLFVFAMWNPVAFSRRMVGLDAVPRELWWLLGAVVSFYFGARELHYVRTRSQKRTGAVQMVSPQDTENAAVRDWQARQ